MGFNEVVIKMKASTIFVLLLMIDGFLFFGAQTMVALDPTSTALEEIGNRAFLAPTVYNNETAIVNTTANATFLSDMTNFFQGGATGVFVTGSQTVVNFFRTIQAFMQFMISFLTMPFTFANLIGATDPSSIFYMAARFFSVIYAFLAIYGLAQIASGRFT